MEVVMVGSSRRPRTVVEPWGLLLLTLLKWVWRRADRRVLALTRYRWGFVWWRRWCYTTCHVEWAICTATKLSEVRPFPRKPNRLSLLRRAVPEPMEHI